MCGIVGLLSSSGAGREVLPKMLDKLEHRGPDDSGVWTDPDSGLTLGHRRLSIIDVSPAGHQPMISASGRYVIVLNGEIYNFESLRASLITDGVEPSWRGHSDTEVLLACIEAYGVDAAIARAQGMFAFAVWDRHSRSLTLARDRMGEKPLYFGWIDGDFVFASELKALAGHPDWAPRIESDRLSQFLRLGYYGGAQSLVSRLFRLQPGTSLSLAGSRLATPRSWEDMAVDLRRYWQLEQVAMEGQRAPWDEESGDVTDELERLLCESVRRQMVADVPLGAFLSGGIDSSLVVALMQKQVTQPVKTFCIGFHDPALDEAGHARMVAGHLGTDHTELYVDDRDALELVPAIPTLFDEPLADPSQLPTLLVAQLARRQVTVALTGDGGDELFGGYTRYPAILRYAAFVNSLPRFARPGWIRAVGRLARSDGLLARLPLSLGERVVRLAARHRGDSLETLRQAHIGGLGTDILLNEPGAGDESIPPSVELSSLRQLLLADQEDYLPNDILMKVDRAAMAVGLETRVPMLDPQVVAFSWRLRDEELLEGGQGKRALKEVAYRHIPKAILDRPKQGFAPPIGKWLRGELRPWAEALLEDPPASLESVVDLDRLSSLWAHHQAGRLDAGYGLWRVLMYVAWAREYRIEG